MNIKEFITFKEKTNEKIASKGIEIRCNTILGDGNYYMLHITKNNCTIQEEFSPRIPVSDNYTEEQVKAINENIEDAVSFITEDKRYFETKEAYNHIDWNYPSVLGYKNMLFRLIMKEDMQCYGISYH